MLIFPSLQSLPCLLLLWISFILIFFVSVWISVHLNKEAEEWISSLVTFTPTAAVAGTFYPRKLDQKQQGQTRNGSEIPNCHIFQTTAEQEFHLGGKCRNPLVMQTLKYCKTALQAFHAYGLLDEWWIADKNKMSSVEFFLSFLPYIQQDDFCPVLLLCKTSHGKIFWGTDCHRRAKGSGRSSSLFYSKTGYGLV